MNTRTEEKYLTPESSIALMLQRLAGCAPVITPDRHGHPDYRVRSLYFDGPDLPCLSENLDGTDNRSKYRLRLYDGSPDLILLEKKKRTGTFSEKTQCRLTGAEAEALLGGKQVPRSDAAPLLNELALLVKASGFKPVLLLEYSRTAFVLTPGRTRITFDRNIRGTAAVGCFFDPVMPPAVPCLPAGFGLVELKYTGFLPDTVSLALGSPALRPTAFSKYRMCGGACGLNEYCLD